MAENTEKCENCRYWLQMNLTDSDGVCRKYPPKRVSSPVGVSTNFPPIKSDQWCGEFKEREE
jgi:hypothetical protein